MTNLCELAKNFSERLSRIKHEKQIVGIEEIVVLKQGMGDRLGFRIEGAVPAKGLTFLLLVEIGWRSHEQSVL